MVSYNSSFAACDQLLYCCNPTTIVIIIILYNMSYELDQTVSVFPPVFWWCVRTRIILYAQSIIISYKAGRFVE
jgi:hypothetical protein